MHLKPDICLFVKDIMSGFILFSPKQGALLGVLITLYLQGFHIKQDINNSMSGLCPA